MRMQKLFTAHTSNRNQVLGGQAVSKAVWRANKEADDIKRMLTELEFNEIDS